MPKDHHAAFGAGDAGFGDLADLFQIILKKLDKIFDYPAYNFVLHTAPFGKENIDHYHWHIELMPKLTKIAGFEWGSGFYINPTPPEEAAKYMREADI